MICSYISQHSYAGNSRVPDGESAAEILTALVEDGLYEHAQFIYSYGDDPEMNTSIEFCPQNLNIPEKLAQTHILLG